MKVRGVVLANASSYYCSSASLFLVEFSSTAIWSNNSTLIFFLPTSELFRSRGGRVMEASWMREGNDYASSDWQSIYRRIRQQGWLTDSWHREWVWTSGGNCDGRRGRASSNCGHARILGAQAGRPKSRLPRATSRVEVLYQWQPALA